MSAGEFERLIPEALAESSAARITHDQIENAMSGAVELVGPHLAIARTLHVINHSPTARPFKDRMVYYLSKGHLMALNELKDHAGVPTKQKTAEELKLDAVIMNGRNVEFRVVSGPNKPLIVQDALEVPLFVISREKGYTNDFMLSFDRRDLTEDLEMISELYRCPRADDVSNALLRFIALDDNTPNLPRMGFDPSKSSRYGRNNPHVFSVPNIPRIK